MNDQLMVGDGLLKYLIDLPPVVTLCSLLK